MLKPNLYLTATVKTLSVGMLNALMTFSCQHEVLFLQFARKWLSNSTNLMEVFTAFPSLTLRSPPYLITSSNDGSSFTDNEFSRKSLAAVQHYVAPTKSK